jgi:deazaflavin-dependent oxidoreductase (nitroreductase family)
MVIIVGFAARSIHGSFARQSFQIRPFIIPVRSAFGNCPTMILTKFIHCGIDLPTKTFWSIIDANGTCQMAKPLSDTDPSRGLLRIGLHMPVYLYRAKLGWLLGDRFLSLTTVGRKSGQPHQIVLEVVLHDKLSGTYYIASGWGEKADWFRNIQANPKVTVVVGSRRFEAQAVRVAPQETEHILLTYAKQHPYAARYLSGVLTGEKFHSPQDLATSIANYAPLIAIQPVSQ